MKLNHRTLSKVAFLVSAMFLVGVVWARAQGGPPDTISYQGYLTDSGGQPIDATVDMQVGFFNVSTGGTAVYTETHSSATVSQGQFNLDLGSGTSSGTWASAVDFSQALWLEITIDPSGTPETLTPRIPLSTAPYARYAFALADNAVTPPKLNGISGSGTSGQVLSSNGSGGFSWADAGTLSAGVGITIANNIISSTATALTVGAGITITNGVISNTLPDPANIIWVATSGGDYTSIQSALDSIGDASASNPYLLMVAPGVYTEQVTMKQYVDIQGAGEGKTIIKWTGGYTHPSGGGGSETVQGADNAELRFLTVESDGTGYSFGLAIYNNAAAPSLLHVTASGSGGSSYNFGIANQGGSPTMNHVTTTGSGGSSAYGVYNQTGSYPEMNHVIATSSDTGVLDNGGATSVIRNSVLSGTNYSFSGTGNNAAVSTSVLEGPVGGSIICTDVRDAAGDMLDSSCAAASAADQVLTSAADGTVSWQDAAAPLTAGVGITIANNIISSTATALTVGAGITITNGVISNTLPDPANIIWVATSGGDYTSIQSALDSIGDASASNPYLLMVAPGVYTEQVTMKQYVDIQGAGEGKTIIKWTGGYTHPSGGGGSETVQGADNAELRFLTVESDGTGYSFGLAIYNNAAAPSLLHVTASGSGGSSYNFGIANQGGSPTMNHVTTTGSGGSSAYGVYNQTGSYPEMNHVIATSSDTGVLDNGGATSVIRNSVLSGTNYSFSGTGNNAAVSTSVLEGPVGGSIICTDVRDAAGDMLDSSCAAASAANQVLTSAADGTVSWQAAGGGGGTPSYSSNSVTISGSYQNTPVFAQCSSGNPIGGGCGTNDPGPLGSTSCPGTSSGCDTTSPTGWYCVVNASSGGSTGYAYVVCQ